MRQRLTVFVDLWQKAPRRIRQTIVLLLGGTVIALGLALIVLPGPFTLPLLLLGFAILGTEFAWATRALERTKEGIAMGGRAAKRAASAAAEHGNRILRRRAR